MSLVRFFWLAVFVLFVGVASFLAEELFFPLRPSFHQETLEWKIHEDLKTLQDKHLLPSEIDKVHEVFVSDRRLNPVSLKWQEIAKFHFPQKTTGQYDLQIEIFEPENSNQKKPPAPDDQVILQFSLFEKDSKNKIWELSRSYLKAAAKK